MKLFQLHPHSLSSLLINNLFHRFYLWLFTFFPQVAPVAIHIQPLQGWHVLYTFPQVFLKTIHFATGCTCGYSYSTPSGLGPLNHLYHRLHLWLFIFNPFGVGASQSSLPQVAPVAIHIQAKVSRSETLA